jgi:hypothetical protein
MGYKMRHLCVLCHFGLEKLKERHIWHFDNGSKILDFKLSSSYECCMLSSG